MKSRNTVALPPPDMSLPWSKFPKSELKPGQRIYRAAKRGKGAWWFCHCGECRFDLSAPRGTCYVGTDPLTGILESIGPDWCNGGPAVVLIPKLVNEREIHCYELPKTVDAANLTTRGALRYRVTNELVTMTPYDVPQQYAKVFDETPGKRKEHQFEAIRFRTRFDTGVAAHGIALFDQEGERPWKSKILNIDDNLIARLEDIGIFVEEPCGTSKANLEVS